MMTSSMTSQSNCNLLKFSGSFFNFSRLQVNLWPQPYHQNDRKKTENLLIYNSKKMLIFDQKILEVAIISDRNETLWKWKREYVQFSESILHGCIITLHNRWLVMFCYTCNLWIFFEPLWMVDVWRIAVEFCIRGLTLRFSLYLKM